MYRKKNRTCQSQLKFVSIENLVPEEHLLRIIDRSINFGFSYEAVKGLYSGSDAGKPGIDLIVFIQHLFGIKSMRQTIREIEVNMAYRWFIGYDMRKHSSFFNLQ